nr:mitochondrial import receptor subunit TOM20-like [Tanacetum cinerariifolium]
MGNEQISYAFVTPDEDKAKNFFLSSYVYLQKSIRGTSFNAIAGMMIGFKVDSGLDVLALATNVVHKLWNWLKIVLFHFEISFCFADIKIQSLKILKLQLFLYSPNLKIVWMEAYGAKQLYAPESTADVLWG